MSEASIQRDREGLLAILERIDSQGWDGTAATALLSYVHEHVVIPQVAVAGIRGAAADQAAATGLTAAWEVLHSSSIRGAGSPWGIIWVAVRRAVLGEVMAAKYGTQPRTAWRLARGEDGDVVAALASLTAFADGGWDLPAESTDAQDGFLDLVAELMVEAGWPSGQARGVIEAVATAAPWGAHNGWRHLARQLNVEPWKMRRLIDTLINVDQASFAELIRDPDARLNREQLIRHLRWTTSKKTPTCIPGLRAAS